MASRHEIMKRNLSDEEEFKPRNNSKLSEDQSSDDDVYNDDGNDGICDDDDHDDDREYEREKYESQSKPKVSMAVKVGNTSKDDSKEEEYGNEDKQVEHPPSAALSKSRSKAFGRRFPFVFGKRHSRPNTKKKLLARIEELENQQAVAQSKMAQMELEMSNETKAVIEERDGLQADLTNLRLLYEDLKTQLENVELELERAKEKENAKSAFEMKRPRARWLWKRGVHGPTGRIWRHRWFKAENDGRLYYYKKKTIQRGFIEIDKITEVQDLPSSKQNKENSCFNIVTPDRTYEMKAEDEDEKIRWIKTLDDLKFWWDRVSRNQEPLPSVSLN